MTVATETCREANSHAVEVQGFYKQYYASKGVDRNDLLSNPGVTFQVLAQDAAIIRALRSSGLNPSTCRVLDVGCGNGSSLWLFLRLGFQPDNLYGVDIQQDLVDHARRIHPLIHFQSADATRLPYEDDSFDLVTEFMMFIHATDEKLASSIAREMVRVTKPGGTLLLADWRYAKVRNRNYKAVTRRRIAQLFRTRSVTEVSARYRGALLPPVGRFLSRHLPSSYFVAQKLFPILTGNIVTVLRKTTPNMAQGV